MCDSNKNFACFLVIGFVNFHLSPLIAFTHTLVPCYGKITTTEIFVGACGRHPFMDDMLKDPKSAYFWFYSFVFKIVRLTN